MKKTPLEELAQDRAKKAIDEFLKNTKMPLPKAVLVAMRPFVPALRAVWVNGFLDAWGLATSQNMEEVMAKVEEFFDQGPKE